MMQNNPQYPQQAGMYQQPMITGNPPPQGFIPVQQDITLGPGGRQDIGGAKASGLQKLDEQPGVFIKQKFELGELVLGCETRNRYHVYALNDDGSKKGRQLFKAKENSGFCTRFCLSGDCRPFNMNIESTIRGEEENSYEPFLHLERPCKCTCLCFNRPELKIYLVQGGGQSEYIGKIVDPWNCCNLEMDIYDKNNIMKYSVVGSCCQLGIWCQCPCEPCQTIDFEVRSGSEVVSHMQKRTPGCLKAAVTDLDNFSMKFPMNATAIDKALLMSAIIMLDYRHFERNPNENNG